MAKYLKKKKHPVLQDVFKSAQTALSLFAHGQRSSSPYISVYIWVCSILQTLLLFLITTHFWKIGFDDIGDDQFLAAYLAGYWTGTPESALPFINPIFAKLLSTLYGLAPNIYWYPNCLLSLSLISCVIIMRCVFLAAYKKKLRIVYSLLINLAVYAIICYDIIWLSFTSAPSIACAAVAAMILCEDYKNRFWILRTALWVFLLFFSYIIRAQSVVVGLCYCAGAVFFRVVTTLKEKQNFSRLLKLFVSVLFAVLLIICAVFSATAFENAPENHDYYEFRRACAEFYDRPHSFTKEQFESVGISPQLRTMMERWFFMDPRVNTQLLNTLSEVNADNAGSLFVFHLTFKDALRMFIKQVQLPGAVPLLIGCIALFIVSAILFFIDKRHTWIGFLTISLLFVGSFILCLYTCLLGRFPTRVFRVVAIPNIVACILILLQSIRFHKQSLVLNYFRLFLLIVPIVCLLFNFHYIQTDKDLQWKKAACISRSHAMDDIATSNPNNLYFYGTKLVSVSEAYPQYTTNTPKNLFYWGGSYLGTQPHDKQMAANGISYFDASLFLQDNVFLITIQNDDEDEILTNYLNDRFGPITCTLVEDYEDSEIQVYQFSK